MLVIVGNDIEAFTGLFVIVLNKRTVLLLHAKSFNDKSGTLTAYFNNV